MDNCEAILKLLLEAVQSAAPAEKKHDSNEIPVRI